jgi:hypothetical protein
MRDIPPKNAEINQTNNLSDDPNTSQPFNTLFEAVPQFHGTIISETNPGFCLTLPATKTLTIATCRNNTLGTYPIQNFAYYDGYLTIRETASCVTPFNIDNCTSSDKWSYNTYTKTLKWEERCVTMEERQSSRVLFYTPCPFSNTTTTKWIFQHILKNDPLPQQIIPKIKSLTQRRFKTKTNKSRKPKTKQRNTATRPTH